MGLQVPVTLTLPKYLKTPAVLELTGWTRRTLEQAVHRGEFPRPIHLTKRSIRWREDVVLEWLRQKEEEAARLSGTPRLMAA